MVVGPNDVTGYTTENKVNEASDFLKNNKPG